MHMFMVDLASNRLAKQCDRGGKRFFKHNTLILYNFDRYNYDLEQAYTARNNAMLSIIFIYFSC